jgi:hypothetical protein
MLVDGSLIETLDKKHVQRYGEKFSILGCQIVTHFLISHSFLDIS